MQTRNVRSCVHIYLRRSVIAAPAPHGDVLGLVAADALPCLSGGECPTLGAAAVVVIEIALERPTMTTMPTFPVVPISSHFILQRKEPRDRGSKSMWGSDRAAYRRAERLPIHGRRLVFPCPWRRGFGSFLVRRTRTRPRMVRASCRVHTLR
jgi:hypothetical protein